MCEQSGKLTRRMATDETKQRQTIAVAPVVKVSSMVNSCRDQRCRQRSKPRETRCPNACHRLDLDMYIASDKTVEYHLQWSPFLLAEFGTFPNGFEACPNPKRCGRSPGSEEVDGRPPEDACNLALRKASRPAFQLCRMRNLSRKYNQVRQPDV